MAPRHRRGRYGPQPRTLVTWGLVCGVALGGGLIAAAAVPLAKGPPSLSLSIEARAPNDRGDKLPFPTQGESAAEVPLFAPRAQFSSGVQRAVPIASLTKLMTAYVTLTDLPLADGADGPSIVVADSNVVEYHHDLRTGQSCVAVAAGEVLTERELLEGLIVHSANNYATLLAEMVAGSTDEMVDDMNAAATTLKLADTTYADVSGFDPASESTAVAQLTLAVRLLANHTFAEIADMTSVTLPVAGLVTTYTPYLGRPHVVGVKSGVTDQAGGCDVMAYDAYLDGQTVQVVAVVLGQRPDVAGRSFLTVAGHAALVLASALAKHLGVWHVAEVDHAVGAIGWPSRDVPVVATSPVAVVTFDGVPATASVAMQPWGANGIAPHHVVATLVVRSGAFRIVSDLVTASALSRPSLWQRLR